MRRPIRKAFTCDLASGLLDWASARDPELLETAIAAGPVLLSVSFGEDWSWVSQVQAAGIATATQISNVESAMRAVDAGIDIIVARGAEGGGHGEPVVGTLPLLEEVLDAVSVPVLAAGGISYRPRIGGSPGCGSLWRMDGDGVRRMLGVLDFRGSPDRSLPGKGTDTVTTTVFDRVLGYPWPAKYPERVLRNQLWQRWSTRESLLMADPEARAEFAEDRESGKSKFAHVDAGQGVGCLTESRPASEIVDDLCAGAIALLLQWTSLRGE